ncbi:MAG: flavodoxin family protein [Oscillospiraceae bacterium]|nr:flavodoxin family protein [Oscillospiraceae bacterium]
MKIAAVNGSPHPEGNTAITIKSFFETLEKDGFETEMLQVGSGAVKGCVACGGCAETGKCKVPDKQFEEWAEKLFAADGVFLAAPVYFGTMPGTMKAFLDRFFFQSIQAGRMRQKVGACAAVLRRSGGCTTLDDLSRYFISSEMIVVNASCPGLVHGRMPGEVLRDAEGMDAVKKLALNMAWVLKMKEATEKQIPPPAYTPKVYMSFIR